MANYYGAARSNYFKVKDPAAYQAFCKRWNLALIHEREGQEALLPDTRYGWISEEEGGIPEYVYDEQGEPEEDACFQAELSAQLADGEVAVAVEVGREKMRYLTAYGWAVDSVGHIIHADLHAELKKRIKRRWPKIEVTEPTW